MNTLVANAMELYKRFCEIASAPRYTGYTLLLVFPQARSDLAVPAAQFESEVKKLGATCHVNAVADADMPLIKGKAGLLSCSMWAIAGAILVNEAPLLPSDAELVLSLANQGNGVHSISNTRNAAIIGSTNSIGPSIRTLREDHTLADLIGSLGNPSGPAQAKKRRWTLFGS